MEPRRDRLLGIATSPGVVFVVAILLLAAIPREPIAHFDTARDLLRAQACVGRGECQTAGPVTRLPELRHGALWNHFLAVTRAAGIDLAGQVALTFLLLAAGVAVLYRTARRRWGVGLAGWGALSLVPALVLVEAYPQFINTSLSHLPLLVLWAAVVEAAAPEERRGWLLAGAVAAGLLMDTYLAFGLLFLAPLALALLTAQRPLRTVVVLVLVFVGVFALSSLQALSLVGGFLVRRPLEASGAALLCAGLAALLLKLRGRWRLLSDGGRVVAALVATSALWLAVGVPLLTRVLSDVDLLPLLPVLPGLVLLVLVLLRAAAVAAPLRALLGGPRGWAVSGLVAALAAAQVALAVAAARGEVRSARLTFDEVEILTAALVAEGFEPAELQYQLQGPLVRGSSLLESMAVFTGIPGPGDRPEPSPRIQVVLMDPAPAELPPGWRRIAGAGGRSLLWQVRTPRLLGARFRVCTGPAPLEGCPVVRDDAGGGHEWVDPFRGPLLHRQAYLQQRRPEWGDVTYGFDVLPGPAGPLVLLLGRETREQFVRLDGVDGDIEDHGRRAVIRSVDRDRGRVWIWTAEDAPTRWYPPVPLELGPGEAALE